MGCSQSRDRLSFNLTRTEHAEFFCATLTMPMDKTDTIIRLHQAGEGVAEQLKALHDSAYSVEARLLGLDEFPPLKRTLEFYAKSKSVFFGYIRGDCCVGSVELDTDDSSILEVSSLVVDPCFSRQGIATKLMMHVLSKAGSRRVIVSTATGNYPAINLYEGLGFRQADHWTTDAGIDLVLLEKCAGNMRSGSNR
jgi:ribosomal protein S18 acetylase RimI-like enzyme